MTSPIDAVYLAAIFNPVFTASYPNCRKVEHLSLLQAILRFFYFPRATPPPNASMVDPSTLLERYPSRPVVMFPECTTTNGRGILPLSHSLIAVPANIKIYPVSVRYTPADITTPIPGSYLTFLWSLLSRPTHCIRVRIAECVVRSGMNRIDDASLPIPRTKSTQGSNSIDTPGNGAATQRDPVMGGGLNMVFSHGEQAVLDSVGDALARLARAKRVGLGVQDKQAFIGMWAKSRQK
jgi:1-acylglycerol-3-phosphate O-acyltransferase